MIRHKKVLSTRIRVSWNRIWKSVTGCNYLQEFENPLDPKTLESGFGDQILWFRKDGGPILKKTYIFAGCKNILICVDGAHSRGILWPIPHLLFLLEFAFHLDETKELAHRKRIFLNLLSIVVVLAIFTIRRIWGHSPGAVHHKRHKGTKQ